MKIFKYLTPFSIICILTLIGITDIIIISAGPLENALLIILTIIAMAAFCIHFFTYVYFKGNTRQIWKYESLTMIVMAILWWIFN